ncbi:hypothetical protein E2C01_088911 [Portunus trituberculatus]|uniref:Uncharacterized protein n=1 Tax=Portunus trituberculatus TaxID=210409 RepID=A0A5B7JAL0_PORTR|nr:hypothetical protein [Portunus trituberculatus]
MLSTHPLLYPPVSTLLATSRLLHRHPLYNISGGGHRSTMTERFLAVMTTRYSNPTIVTTDVFTRGILKGGLFFPVLLSHFYLLARLLFTPQGLNAEVQLQ